MKNTAQRCITFILSMLLSACATQQVPHPQAAGPLLIPAYTDSASHYLQQAQTDDTTTQHRALLNAAGRLIEDKQTARAAQLLHDS